MSRSIGVDLGTTNAEALQPDGCRPGRSKGSQTVAGAISTYKILTVSI
jgi:hypothetical protein